MMRRWYKLAPLGLAILLLATAFSPPTLAYETGTRWMTDDYGGYLGNVEYRIDPNLDADLSRYNGANVQGAADQVRIAVSRANQPSRFTLMESNAAFDPSYRNIVSSSDFVMDDKCGGLPADFAIQCPDENSNTGRKFGGRIYFNGGPSMRWNTTGFMRDPGNSMVRDADVLDIALHEILHLMGLGHDCRNYANNPSVSCFQSNQTVQNLFEDDKQGLIQLYGPYTGWEENQSQARGEINRLAYALDAAGYNNNFSPPPELGPVTNEAGNFGGIAPLFGSKYERMAGYAQSGNAYTYYTLFTGENDTNQDANHQSRTDLKIQPGMKLHWYQANYQQDTISIDLEFTDGSTLRDYHFPAGSGRDGQPITDNYGISIHPAERHGAQPMGQWVEYVVDLSPLAGRTVKRWLLAYDNSNTGVTGQYRAYFDFLSIIPPDSGGLNAFVTGSGSVSASPPGPDYAPNTVVTYTATPSSGWLFTGWLVDGYKAGWANPLTVTQDVRHTVTANFAPRAAFSDVASSAPYYNAVTQLAARNIIKGCDPAAGLFCPNDIAVRAQSAAFIARAVGWDPENWGNPFPDKCDPGGQFCIDDALWRNVGTLNHYGVATGYTDAGTCTTAGTTTPCYLPRQSVLNIQVVSFLTRAMIAKGYWARQADNPAFYTNVPASGTQRSDLATYVFYAGAVPDRPTSGPFTGYDQPAARAFFARAEWQALDSYFRVDRVP